MKLRGVVAWTATLILMGSMTWAMMVSLYIKHLADSPTVEVSEYPELPDSIEGLTLALKSENGEVRYLAARALGSSLDEALGAIPFLIDNLTYRNSEVRRANAWALGEVGVPADCAVQALVRMSLDDNSHDTRIQALASLGKIDHSSAVPFLVPVLYTQEDVFILSSAADAISTLANLNLPYARGGRYSINEEGTPYIGVAARIWWETEGVNREWPDLPPDCSDQ